MPEALPWSARPRPSWPRRVLFVVVIVCAVLAIAEVAVRILGVAPVMLPLEITTPNATFVASSNPRLGWYPKPGSADINADGFRDRGYHVERKPGTLRMAVIGDSITFGACVPKRDETFPKVIEQRLREHGLGAQVMNLGVPGYDTVQEVEFLKERGLRFSPDVVLVAVCLNDFDSMSGAGALIGLAEHGAAHTGLASALRRRLLLSSHLFRLGFSAIDAAANKWHRARPRAGPAPGPKPDPVSQGFDELARVAAEHHLGVVVTVFPVFSTRQKPEADRLRAVVAEHAHAHGWDVLDLHDAYAKITNPREVACDGLHPNPAGHLIAGDAIAKFLLEDPARLGGTTDLSRRSAEPGANGAN